MHNLWFVNTVAILICSVHASAAEVQERYYAHPAVEDEHGVIAPWYTGQNGQCDLRVRIAAETLKRYPWTTADRAAAALPEYVFSGAWTISPEGTITVPPIGDWENGDLGQRAAYVLSGLVDYYRYSGDAAAIAHIHYTAEALINYCLTPPEHPWPGFLISVPTKGEPYQQADPHGFIQLDITAEVGIALVHASQLTGNTRWLKTAQHWGDLLAEHRNREPGLPPWPRYANPQDVPWEDQATGGVAFILEFFDALIRSGYRGHDDAIIQAREDGVAYLRDVLLPDWTGSETWGRNYWDWPCPVQVENVTEFAARYLMDHPDEFPDWRNDARNIMTLFLNRTSVSPESKGDVYSGAWAYPESSGCCGRSLWYGPMELAFVYAQYGLLADSEWGREMARRQIILATYDVHETGVVEDNIDGGGIVADAWFKIAHPMALKHTLAAMAWLPETLGAARENHIMRSTAVVTNVAYGGGFIAYSTYDAPPHTVEVLRLASEPFGAKADGRVLERRNETERNGYKVDKLPNGDCMVTIRHDGRKNVIVYGGDYPQNPAQREFDGKWGPHPRNVQTRLNPGEECYAVMETGAKMSCTFTGNQCRVLGDFGPEGGLADVYLDGVKQLVGIDCWNPQYRKDQVLYYINGLENAEHKLEVVVRGAGNPLSQGTNVTVGPAFVSAATGDTGFGAVGGPTGAQRMIFGYTGRQDYVDSQGHAWRPGTEFVIRLGDMVDSVNAWWTQRRRLYVAGTEDPELYRYGVHGRDFWVNFTVGPGRYHARIKFLETRRIEPAQRAVTVHINGREAAKDLDIAATAGEPHRAVDFVFNGIEPANGIVCIRFRNDHGGEAVVQAIELAPGDGSEGLTPVCLPSADAPPESKRD